MAIDGDAVEEQTPGCIATDFKRIFSIIAEHRQQAGACREAGFDSHSRNPFEDSFVSSEVALLSDLALGEIQRDIVGRTDAQRPLIEGSSITNDPAKNQPDVIDTRTPGLSG
nr:hypothetical protein [Rhodoplanes sp. Z2-YC6860]